ncbi:hypothetical protein K7X08_023305 [Anisodus acutangulus]|uniref:Uncharacterized protein n=1 Tax=Anisodus acutangulus TaxID=402998 RepID=A0A9Q1LG37_9SOLA|nr:hypothetical protein K7X08_023305 [Anisodus acutangulus]
MPYFLPHQISPPNKLVVLNQICLDLPTTSSEESKWGDDEEDEVADNEESSGGLQKGKEPMESQIADDMTESTEDRKPNPNSNKFDALRKGDGDHVEKDIASNGGQQGGGTSLNVNAVIYTPKKKTKSLVTTKQRIDKAFSKAVEKLDPKSVNVMVTMNQ